MRVSLEINALVLRALWNTISADCHQQKKGRGKYVDLVLRVKQRELHISVIKGKKLL